MKAINKLTGETVEIIRWGNDGSFTEFRDSNGYVLNLSMNYYEDFERIVESEDAIDWEQRRYEIAKEMLPVSAQSVNASTQDWMTGMSYSEASATIAIGYADALIKELKKGVENGNK